MNKTIGVPEGTRNRLFAECASLRRVERAALGVFRRQGYCEMETPHMEYYDLIAAAGYPMAQESLLKIIDRSGKIVVLRPDCTLAMGRVAASNLRDQPLPLRLYYHQTVFRSDDANIGARSEIDQCGVELIGATGLRADLEVISLAIEALDACGLEDYHLEIGHAGYFGALLDALGLEGGEQERLRRLVEDKEFTAFRAALGRYGSAPAVRALEQLPRLFGGPEVLETARRLCDCPAALAVLEQLETLYRVLEGAGLSGRVRFDLGLIQTIEYYTGMVFRGYGQGAAGTLLSGGRYDKLIGCFGADMPATGFAMDMEAVAACLPEVEHRPPETLVYYELGQLGRARELVASMPEGSAMLSCESSPDAAAREGRGLGARRLVILADDGMREVAL